MPMPKAEPPRPSLAPAAEKPERRPAPAPAPARAPAPSPAPAAAPTPAEWGRLIATVRERVAERIDLSRVGIFGEETRRKVADAAREVISGGKGGIIPPGVDADLLHADVVAEVVGLGPLESLLGDAEVTEILVNEPAAVFVERAGKLTRVARAFSSGEALLDVVRRLVARGGGALPEDEPVVEVRLPDGIRLTAVLPPFAPRGPSLVVRKVSRQSRDLADLVRAGALSEAMARFLDLCVRARRNLVFSGGAGSGKSALLGATAALIPGGERVVTVEETAELTVPHEHLVSLEARLAAEDGREATMRDLVRAAMRLRPDWLVVGDCRGPEAFDLVQAMAGGRDGVLVCVHAHSPREALARLEAMALLAAEAPSRGAREPVVQACHVVVQLTRYPDGVRRVAQVAEVAGLEGDRPVAKEIFSYIPGEGRGRFAASGYIPRFVDDLTRRGLAVDLSIFRE
jgi:pilus assembly protein CpaF